MDYAVRFENVYKGYPFYQHITAGFKSFLFNLPRNISSLKKSTFIALKGISFEVEKGQTFGIIGRNGAGKSTILGLMAGVMRPDRGVVMTDGKISSLLELGAGFHPDLSGIENIILNGILMGNTRQDMMRKMEMIIDFSELGDFIYQPLRTYSSGMHARLGFSVAVHVEPEILLIDEILSVGDMNFQEKCYEKMKEFEESGATIIIVSHDMDTVAKVCDRVAWIDGGKIMEVGEAREVVTKYLYHSGTGAIVEEVQTPRESEMECPPAGDAGSLQIRGGMPTRLIQPVTPVRNTKKILPVRHIQASWWDSPPIMHECETLITGNHDVDFYEFLKRECSVVNLQKGLSICTRLKGVEKNFIKYNICRSFNVIYEAGEIESLLTGPRNFKNNYYELFLCVDLLNRVDNLDKFLIDVYGTLKEGGFIIALEYVGPALFKRSDRELEIADMIYEALDGVGAREYTKISASSVSRQPQTNDMNGAVNSENVISEIKKYFDILSIRYFAGPLFDLVLNKILYRFDPANKKDSALIKTIIQCEQILIRENILKNNYAVIIAKKKNG
jgi:lipopolysaccharide transport system ATP-binding protein